MRVFDAKALIGKIVTLDLITGIRLTTKIESVEQEEGGWFFHTGPLLIYVIQIVGQDDKTGEMKLNLQNVIPYGIPDFQPTKKNYVDLSHVFTAATPMANILDHYAKATSSIVAVSAGTPLPSMDALASQMQKFSAKS